MMVKRNTVEREKENTSPTDNCGNGESEGEGTSTKGGPRREDASRNGLNVCACKAQTLGGVSSRIGQPK